MPNDLRVVLPNRPGTLAAALQTVADAGVNVAAACGDLRPGERWGYGHVLVDDADAAAAALQAAGFEVAGIHDVDVVDLPADRPGALAEVIARYTHDGRNLEVFYTADKGRVVVGTEDMQKPRLGVQVKDVKY